MLGCFLEGRVGAARLVRTSVPRESSARHRDVSDVSDLIIRRASAPAPRRLRRAGRPALHAACGGPRRRPPCHTRCFDPIAAVLDGSLLPNPVMFDRSCLAAVP